MIFAFFVVTPSLSNLDESMLNRAAPPGSLRYFALLYTAPEKRDAVAALFIVDAEIRESARSANHDVAHTRLQWWRTEIDRLVNGSAQHPAVRALNEHAPRHAAFAKLHELIAAADMDLARMTYANARELRAYSARSGGAVVEVIASLLAAPDALSESDRSVANRIGVGVRQTEMLRDLHQDACEGRMYLPLGEAEAQSIQETDLRARELGVNMRTALKVWAARVHDELDLRHSAINDARLRPLCVLAMLHARLLDRIAAHNYDVGAGRIELGPIETPWVAWRAARRI